MTTKRLRAGAMTSGNLASQKYAEYFEITDGTVTVEDIFHPAFWEHIAARLKPYYLVRLVCADDNFDFVITVKAVLPGGVLVAYYEGILPEGVDGEQYRRRRSAKSNVPLTVVSLASDGKPEVRVEHQKNSGWRLIGLSSKEVQRAFNSRDEAEDRMKAYLVQLHMRLPTDAEIAAQLADRAKKPEKADA